MSCCSPGRLPRTSIDIAASPDSKKGSQPDEPFFACCWASGTARPSFSGSIISAHAFSAAGVSSVAFTSVKAVTPNAFRTGLYSACQSGRSQMPYWVCDAPEPTANFLASASMSLHVQLFVGNGTPALVNSSLLYMMTVASASFASAKTCPTPNGAPTGGMYDASNVGSQ